MSHFCHLFCFGCCFFTPLAHVCLFVLILHLCFPFFAISSVLVVFFFSYFNSHYCVVCIDFTSLFSYLICFPSLPHLLLFCFGWLFVSHHFHILFKTHTNRTLIFTSGSTGAPKAVMKSDAQATNASDTYVLEYQGPRKKKKQKKKNKKTKKNKKKKKKKTKQNKTKTISN
jgi:hypothetical protein